MDNIIDMNEILKELQFQVDCYDDKVIDGDELNQAIQEIVWHYAEVHNIKPEKITKGPWPLIKPSIICK